MVGYCVWISGWSPVSRGGWKEWVVSEWSVGLSTWPGWRDQWQWTWWSGPCRPPTTLVPLTDETNHDIPGEENKQRALPAPVGNKIPACWNPINKYSQRNPICIPLCYAFSYTPLSQPSKKNKKKVLAPYRICLYSYNHFFCKDTIGILTCCQVLPYHPKEICVLTGI